MHLPIPIPIPLLLLTTTLLPLSLSLASPPSPFTIHYTPLLSTTPHPLAYLTLTPPALQSFTPPPLSSSQTLLRLSTAALPHAPSTLTTLTALHTPGGTFRIVLSPLDNSTLSISYHAPLTGGETENVQALPAVEIAYPAPAPRPVLNTPVVLDEEGKVARPEEPKGLLQRYWWVLLAMAVLAMAGSGESK